MTEPSIQPWEKAGLVMVDCPVRGCGERVARKDLPVHHLAKHVDKHA